MKNIPELENIQSKYFRTRKDFSIITYLLGPVILAETLALDHDPIPHAPSDLVV